MSEITTNKPETFGPADNEESTFSGDVIALAPTAKEGDKPAVARVHAGPRANHILFTFTSGQELREHMAAHPITVSCPQGSIEFEVTDGETVTLKDGMMMHLPARVPHAVRGGTEGGILWLIMHTG